MITIFFAEANEGIDVLWETAAAVTDSRIKKFTPDAFVESHTLGDLQDIGAHVIANLRDSVDERYFGGQKRVRSVLDQFRRIDIGDDHHGLQRRVHLAQEPFGPGRLNADDDTIGVHKIMDRGTLAQKFRIGGHIEIQRHLISFAEFPGQVHGNGAFNALARVGGDR